MSEADATSDMTSVCHKMSISDLPRIQCLNVYDLCYVREGRCRQARQVTPIPDILPVLRQDPVITITTTSLMSWSGTQTANQCWVVDG